MDLPKDFPERGKHQDRLKKWHSTRNEADYSPYVAPEQSLRELQQRAKQEAAEFVQACRGYLQGRGAIA